MNFPTGVSSPVGDEQLDTIRPDENGRGVDALVGELSTMLERRTEDIDVCPERAIEIVDGDADVMDAKRSHGGDATAPSPFGRGSSTSSRRP